MTPYYIALVAYALTAALFYTCIVLTAGSAEETS